LFAILHTWNVSNLHLLNCVNKQNVGNFFVHQIKQTNKMWGKLCLPNCVHKKKVGNYVYQILHIENVVIISTKLFRQNCVNSKFTKNQFIGRKSHGRSFSLSLSFFLHDHLFVYYETTSIVTFMGKFHHFGKPTNRIQM
jgi:hypothetical protein